MKFVLTIVLFLFSIVSTAIVHVGNGGGEAEMLTLQFASGLVKWAEVCNQNAGLCGIDIHFTERDKQFLARRVAFVEAGQSAPACLADQINVVRESLYIKNDQPRSRAELSAVLVKTILTCAGWNADKVNRLKFDLDLRVRSMTNMNLSVFSGSKTDVIAAQALLQKSMRCLEYRLLSSVNNYLYLNCVDDRQNYIVLVKLGISGLEFIARVDSEL